MAILVAACCRALAKLERPVGDLRYRSRSGRSVRARERVAEVAAAVRVRIVDSIRHALPGAVDRALSQLVPTRAGVLSKPCLTTHVCAISCLRTSCSSAPPTTQPSVFDLLLQNALLGHQSSCVARGQDIRVLPVSVCVETIGWRCWPWGLIFASPATPYTYIDLYAFLSGAHVSQLDGSDLDKELIASRRDGFRELSGILRGYGVERRCVTLASFRSSQLPFVIQFITPSLHWIVREAERKAWCADMKLVGHGARLIYGTRHEQHDGQSVRSNPQPWQFDPPDIRRIYRGSLRTSSLSTIGIGSVST